MKRHPRPKVRRLGVEARFLVPVTEDQNLGSGRLHPIRRWQSLDTALREEFGGFSVSLESIRGLYPDPDTGEGVADESRQYYLALRASQIERLRRFLARYVAPMFVQKCIYFVVAGKAELVFNADL